MKFNIKNILIFSIIIFILLYLRRGNQLVNPEIWNEDGTQNFISFLKYGWMNLVEPVSGYLITIPKLITNISLSISAIYYPEISTYLAWIFTIMVALAVVFSPTTLKYTAIAAIMIFLIPTNAEVYGLPLYTFWFSSILLFLVALWRQEEHLILKNVFLLFGGLSSALIVLIVPVQIFRSVFYKHKKEELFTLFLAIILASIQLIFIIQTHAKSHIPDINFEFIQLVFIKFFAYYFARDLVNNDVVLSILGVSVFLSIIWFILKNKKDLTIYILLFLLLSSIALSVVRLEIQIINPIQGGPRYFFFPYILLSWILLYIIANNKKLSFIYISIVVLSFILASKNFTRGHDRLSWKDALYTCAKYEGEHKLPIQYDGSINSIWHIELKNNICEKLVKNDMFSFPKNVHVIPKNLLSIKKLEQQNTYNISINNNRYSSNKARKELLVSTATSMIKIKGCVADNLSNLRPKAILVTLGSRQVFSYISTKELEGKKYCENMNNVGYIEANIDICSLDNGKHRLNITTLKGDYSGYYNSIQLDVNKSNFTKYIFEKPVIEKPLKGWIEKFEFKDDYLYIEGWYSKINSVVKSQVLLLKIDEKRYVTCYSYQRKGVAKVLNNEVYTNVGFKLYLSKDEFTSGKHIVRAQILSDDQSIVYEDTKVFEFELD